MPKLDPIPDSELEAVLGSELFSRWRTVVKTIEALYDMDKVWHTGGKAANYELKFRRGGKTLASLFAREGSIGLMLIFGGAEREKFEARQAAFSASVVEEYQKAATYHDGKWVMYTLPNEEIQADLPALLAIKRKPNRKKE